MDIKSGYRHFRLAPAMRDWFIFHYEGRFYQCISLSFGWGRSPLWCTRFMKVFVQELRRWNIRVPPYIDDFLIAPSKPGTTATLEDCRVAAERIDRLLHRLGLLRHPTKGEWTGSQTLLHLGVEVDSVKMRFKVAPHKLLRVQGLACDFLRQARMGRRFVSLKALSHFCGVCVSLSLALPWARFYTRSLYWDMSERQPRDRRGRCKLSHQSIRDLLKWRSLSKTDLMGRNILPIPPDGSLHMDASDVGYGGTLNNRDMRLGVAGQTWDQGLWLLEDRAKSITYRELEAIRRGSTATQSHPITVPQLTPSRRQPGSGSYGECIRILQSSHDEGVTQTEKGTRSARTFYPLRVATIHCEPLRRRVIATLPPRLASPQAAAAFRRGWYGGSSRRVSISTPRRASLVSASPKMDTVGQPMGSRHDTNVEPASGSNQPDSPQTPRDEGPGNDVGAEVAEAAMVSSSSGHGIKSDRVESSAERGIVSTAVVEPGMEAASPGDQLLINPSTPAMSRSARLCNLTDGARGLHARATHSERRAGRRRIGSSSVPQYFSALRQRQLCTIRTAVPDHPFVHHVLRAFARWEEQEFPSATVRVGLNATQMKAIWELGMISGDIRVIRDSAMCLFAFSFNGLRESSVASLLSANVEIMTDRMTARLSIVKGRSASREQLVAFTGHPVSSPLSLWSRYSTLRETHARYFALPGEPVNWQPQSLNAALKGCLLARDIVPPTGATYSSHSLRIGAHTEQVLLGIPLEVSMARFGWGARSADMANVYFDRTIVTTPASFWIFGAGVRTLASVSTSTQ